MLICSEQSIPLLVASGFALGFGSHFWLFLGLLLLAGAALGTDEVDHDSDDSEGVPERSVAEDGERGDPSEDFVLLDPEEQGESEEGGQFEGPALGEEQHGGAEQSNHNESEVVLQVFLNLRSEAVAVGHGAGELLVEGSDGLLVRVDEVGLEDD